MDETDLKNVAWAITDLCNLNCLHCAYPTKSLNDVSTKEALCIINQLHDCGVEHVAIDGGEPFMRKDIIKILHNLDNCDIDIEINTNGTLISDYMTRSLSNLNNISEIYISVDGLQETHDIIRGKKCFDGVIESIKKLKNEGLPVYIATTVNRHNYKDLYDIVNLAIKLEVEGIILRPLHILGRAIQNKKDLILSDIEEISAIKNIFLLYKSHGDFIKGPFVYWLEQFIINGENAISQCSGGKKACLINSEGNVSPCYKLEHLCSESLKDKRLIEIWDNSIIFRKIRCNKNNECFKCAQKMLSFCQKMEKIYREVNL